MSRETVLIVEDDDDILELERYNLAREGYRVVTAVTGEEGLKLARSEMPNLIVLDLMLPGVPGTEVCKVLRNDAKTEHIPILMVTARTEESDQISGLELGADDYVTKPFSPRVLVARVKAALRRSGDGPAAEDATLRIHDVTLHPGRHEVLVGEEPVDLTSTEFRVLHLLARRPGWVFTRPQIVDAVHGDNYAVTERSVDVQIVGLRRKLGPAASYIETVRGVGYRFKE